MKRGMGWGEAADVEPEDEDAPALEDMMIGVGGGQGMRATDRRDGPSEFMHVGAAVRYELRQS